ncbi:MAG: DUF1653 domain-containing protein [Lachnospiraceae bacterium]|nr:DUF1653 domain-containing protein [Lachnospiraceae bacterium]
MSFIPKPNEIYKHFKGQLYRIVTVATHSETGEELVIYEALYGDHKVYARPISMFTSPVDKDKYPDVTQEYRFEIQTDAEPEEVELDESVVEFLDASTYGEKLNILASMKHKITDDMITTMAVSCDLEVDEGDTESRYQTLKNCLLTLEKYECSRLRG